MKLPRWSHVVWALVIVGIVLAAGCRQAPAPPVVATALPPWFEDATEELGLNFVHDAGPTGSYFMPQIMGSGAALFDFDNDGRLDIFLLQNGGPKGATCRLYHQEKDGRFTDVSAGSGLDVAGWNMGVAVGDVNNDGFPDVLVTQYGGLRLFLNNGNGTFTDVTKEAGLESTLWGASACFVDYDRDGWLDLVVVNYLDFDPSWHCNDQLSRRDFCHPKSFPGSVTRLYRNLGHAAGRAPGRVAFEDVTLKSGLGKAPGAGLGVFCADFDGDGWPDILVTNDSQVNRLWINGHDGTFKDEALIRGIAMNGMGQPQGNMGIAVGDINGDGLFDVFITHLNEEVHAMYMQGPRGYFRDQTPAVGLTRGRWRGTGFGTVLADFDQDGTLDLAFANGGVSRKPAAPVSATRPFWEPYLERNQLFANKGDGKFQDISEENSALCGTPRIARGMAVGDVTGDGALDLLVTYVAEPARLYRNVAPNRGHWLLVRALDPALKRDAYGAVVTIRSGERRWTGWVNPGSSFLCSNDPRVHFGLGACATLDGLRVLWPDGTTEEFSGRSADQVVELRKGEGRRP